ncbi:MAG: Maf family nucleotide pyrophosphatase [Proteobacteria bacterium]|nr:Maf family nucleotide pyrophosphatase [Pseudomonadota bacterium]MCH9712005.1 Maf family nucleotide pyrophosphatase [Pseudomonadota bacterium]MCH9749314.1 Maf family nucleotide pyrophosphatase [Pseudomonadota bacterium]
MVSILQTPIALVSLILASSSAFRKELLEKLGLSFATHSPEIDESRNPGETPEQLVFRLAQDKAQAVAKFHQGLIIASDQVATLQDGQGANDHVLGKPHTHENAVEQLSECSGRTVTFVTSLCLLNTNNSNIQTVVEKFKVTFRTLSLQQIESYLKKEQPYNCAGSFKSEGLGISLFSRLEGNDPNTLIGLPLIQLIKLLDNEDIDVLSSTL